MAIAVTHDRDWQKRFAESDYLVKVKECDSDGSPLTDGDGTQWSSIGACKDIDIKELLDEYKDKGASGKISQDEETVEQYEVPLTLMQRDAQSRNLTKNARGRYYQVAIQGVTVGTETEYHVFGIARIKGPFSYGPGQEGKISGIKLVSVYNEAAISVTLPTDWVTGTITVSAGDMWASEDL